jgi:predicted RNase H-like nuclease (RuvC/YqgF family)
VSTLLKTAKRTKNFALANLAVSTQLDAFTKVKEAMDKFMVELKKQQKDEYEKNEFCKKEIDANEDQTKVKTHEKDDLDDHLAEVENTIRVLVKEIDELKTEVGEMKISLKRAGEDRKAENQDFQAQVADQRAVMNLLNKVLARLKKFYGFVQTGQEPGAAVEAPPPKPKEYNKSAGSGGALQLIAMIIEEAKKEEAELVLSEQDAQEGYASFVSETNSCLAACDKSIAEKSEAQSIAESDKAETEAAILAVTQELTSLKDLNIGLHADCDFLLENFEIRQKARKDEMNAIEEAKAILSGADFGL